jgi:hypothetical protein
MRAKVKKVYVYTADGIVAHFKQSVIKNAIKKITNK